MLYQKHWSSIFICLQAPRWVLGHLWVARWCPVRLWELPLVFWFPLRWRAVWFVSYFKGFRTEVAHPNLQILHVALREVSFMPKGGQARAGFKAKPSFKFANANHGWGSKEVLSPLGRVLMYLSFSSWARSCSCSRGWEEDRVGVSKTARSKKTSGWVSPGREVPLLQAHGFA